MAILVKLVLAHSYDETRWNNSETSPASSDGGYFNGVIDEVALYNTILSQSRIEAHAGGCSPTAVTLANFDATPIVGEVHLTWETAMELDAIGFNVFRSKSCGWRT